jgi:hypothetical protein
LASAGDGVFFTVVGGPTGTSALLFFPTHERRDGFSSGQAKVLRVVVSSKKKSRSQFRVVLADSSGDLLFFFAELAEIAGGLDERIVRVWLQDCASMCECEGRFLRLFRLEFWFCKERFCE